MTQLAASLVRNSGAETASFSGVAGVRLIAAASAFAWCLLLWAAFALF